MFTSDKWKPINQPYLFGEFRKEDNLLAEIIRYDTDSAKWVVFLHVGNHPVRTHEHHENMTKNEAKAFANNWFKKQNHTLGPCCWYLNN